MMLNRSSGVAKRVVVMRGISGSGKSTLARRIAEGSAGAVIVSSDDYMETPEGYQWAQHKLGPAHQQCFRLFMAAVQAEARLIVVDNTNGQALEIAPYMMAAGAYGYEASIVEAYCDPQIAADRNKHGTPVEVIEKMVVRMANERLAPWWDVIRVDTGHPDPVPV